MQDFYKTDIVPGSIGVALLIEGSCHAAFLDTMNLDGSYRHNKTD